MGHPTCSRLRTPLVVFKMLDIIISQITSRFHLDEFQRDLARVFEVVCRAARDVHALIFTQDRNLVASGDVRSSLHYSPVFRPIVVDLQ
jgi:hypothetical protein